MDEQTDPLSKKLAGTPDQSIYTDGDRAPVLAYREELRSPVEGRVATIKPFDPLTGRPEMRCIAMVYNVDDDLNEAILTPTAFKTVAANLIGSTALWTPGSGNKFRILGFKVFIPSTATTAAGSTITLKDDATTIFTLAVLGTTTQIVNYQHSNMVNGYLSAAADNVLNVNLSAALTAGAVVVDVWGVEE